jgi:hypothetical protein
VSLLLCLIAAAAVGKRVIKKAELRGAIREMLDTEGPYLLEVMVPVSGGRGWWWWWWGGGQLGVHLTYNSLHQTCIVQQYTGCMFCGCLPVSSCSHCTAALLLLVLLSCSTLSTCCP